MIYILIKMGYTEADPAGNRYRKILLGVWEEERMRWRCRSIIEERRGRGKKTLIHEPGVIIGIEFHYDCRTCNYIG